ncbi:hypothetical protein DID88_008967 [Monilinia fructigena]|uniref:Uncharacterized protein n=1 Tax=Monilinia fructigena TaxID=38457 RepID=A0A395J7Z9_9HELO|nr:hypothetical protein DID88_008967 [Monilinia fructigena]
MSGCMAIALVGSAKRAVVNCGLKTNINEINQSINQSHPQPSPIIQHNLAAFYQPPNQTNQSANLISLEKCHKGQCSTIGISILNIFRSPIIISSLISSIPPPLQAFLALPHYSPYRKTKSTIESNHLYSHHYHRSPTTPFLSPHSLMSSRPSQNLQNAKHKTGIMNGISKKVVKTEEQREKKRSEKERVSNSIDYMRCNNQDQIRSDI